MDKLEDQTQRDAAAEDSPPEPLEAVEGRAPVRTPLTELFAGSFD